MQITIHLHIVLEFFGKKLNPVHTKIYADMYAAYVLFIIRLPINNA